MKSSQIFVMEPPPTTLEPPPTTHHHPCAPTTPICTAATALVYRMVAAGFTRPTPRDPTRHRRPPRILHRAVGPSPTTARPAPPPPPTRPRAHGPRPRRQPPTTPRAPQRSPSAQPLPPLFTARFTDVSFARRAVRPAPPDDLVDCRVGEDPGPTPPNAPPTASLAAPLGPLHRQHRVHCVVGSRRGRLATPPGSKPSASRGPGPRPATAV